MLRIIFCIVVLLVMPSVQLVAEDTATPQSESALRLLCNIVFNNFEGVD